MAEGSRVGGQNGPAATLRFAHAFGKAPEPRGQIYANADATHELHFAKCSNQMILL